MKRLSILISLWLTVLTGAANDFSGDPNCVALWRYEPGDSDWTVTSPMADWSGNNNVILLQGSSYIPVSDTTNEKEGTGCADLECGTTSQVGAYFNRANANLSANFPLKSTYSNPVHFSFVTWFKPENLPTGGANDALRSLFAKNDSANNKRTFLVCEYYNGSDAVVEVGKGYNSGNSWEMLDHTTALVSGRWYHVGVTYNDETKFLKIRLWDDTAQSVVEVSTTQTNAINLEDAPLYVSQLTLSLGQYYEFDGLLDETACFNDILSSSEIDQIRQGVYGILGNNWWWRRRHSQLPDHHLWAMMTSWLDYHYRLQPRIVSLLDLQDGQRATAK